MNIPEIIENYIKSIIERPIIEMRYENNEDKVIGG